MTLYRIRMTYCLNVQANTREEAFAKACKQIAENPNIVISTVEDSSVPQERSVVKRLLTGR